MTTKFPSRPEADLMVILLNFLYPTVDAASDYRVESRGEYFVIVRDYYGNVDGIYTTEY